MEYFKTDESLGVFGEVFPKSYEFNGMIIFNQDELLFLFFLLSSG
jgi:hypothetical protein